MKIAILTLTKGGLEQGRLVEEKLNIPVDLYGQEKFGGQGYIAYEKKVSEVFKDTFESYDIILAIMATGIVVRSIKDLIGHKSSDPGILVMDERGHHVISLLSGHLGGGNYWTHYIARKIGADPVITTASDVTGKLSVDQIAENHGLRINDFYDAMKVTAAIVNDESVGLINDLALDLNTFSKISPDMDFILVVGNKSKDYYRRQYNLKVDAMISILSEKNLIVGIGCRKGVSFEHMDKSFKEALKNAGKTVHDVRMISTVDLKKDEKAILMLSEKYKLPLNIVDREAIKEVEEHYELSEFVKKTIGVGAVCEPVAEITGKPGRFLMRKTAFDGITLSILEEDYE